MGGSKKFSFEDVVNPFKQIENTGKELSNASDNITDYLNEDLKRDLTGANYKENVAKQEAGREQVVEARINDIKKVEDLTLERDRQRARMKGLASAGRGSTLLTSPLGIVDDTLGSRGGKSLLGV